jgi:hypothetical protein
MSSSDGKEAEPVPEKEKGQSLSSDSSEESSSSSEDETPTPPPNKRPRKAHGEQVPQASFDPRVDSIINQVSYLTNFLLQSQAASGEGPSTQREQDDDFLVRPRQVHKIVDLGEINTEIKEGTLVQPAEPENLRALDKLHKFNSPAWQAVRYKNSLKSVLATPGFVELKINEELTHFNKGKDYLASTENVLAGLINAVLTNRNILKEGLQELIDWSSCNKLNADTLYEKVSSIFGSGSAIYKNYETTLQIMSGKRTECIEVRRNRILNEVSNANLKASLKNIPPSNEFLFSREAMTPLIQSLGGTQVWLNTPTYMKEAKKMPSTTNTARQPEKQVREYDNSGSKRVHSDNQSYYTNPKRQRKNNKQGFKQNKPFHFNNASAKKK